MELSPTKIIAEYAADSRSAPKNVMELANIFVVDTFACIFAGTGTDAVKILAAANKWAGTSDDVPVPGWGFAKTFDGAAQVLGTAAHAYDFDDTSLSMQGHPSAPIVAALLATAFDLSINGKKKVSGLEFINAYVKGLEVTCRVGELMGQEHRGLGWHTISTVGTLGAAIACSALRGHSKNQNAMALAIAGSQACGLLNNSGTMVKPLHCGEGARAGYMAAALAGSGFTASGDIIEGGSGFIEGFAYAFTGGKRSEIILPSLPGSAAEMPPLNGVDFELIKPGMEIKRYPCCQVAHVNIDAMKKIRTRQDFSLENIEKIICYVSSEQRMRYLQCPNPKNATEARFSMNFVVTAAMVFGEVTLDHFNDELIASEDFQQKMPLVDMRLQDKTGDEAVDVEVVFNNGKRIRACGAYEPVTWSEIEKKFRNCMNHAAQPVKNINIFANLRNLERQADVTQIFS